MDAATDGAMEDDAMAHRFPLLLAGALALALPAQAAEDAWTDLKGSIFGDAAIGDGAAMIAIDAPTRAHDASAVPLGVEITPPPGRRVARLTIVIDENPAPVAAEIEVGPGMGRTVALSTRVRVDAYSHVRVIAALDDGTRWHAARFVKASGGCAAPAMAQGEDAASLAGTMDLRLTPAAAPQAELAIRHPNHSGFQRDQVSLLYIPPWYVDLIEVHRGGALVMRVAGGISLSEDPSITFGHAPGAEGPFTVRVEDTDGGVFQRRFEAVGS